ncbi:hypothetical protein C7S16_1995 [Burkholderia thailandensis]|uniref:Uncharacterized protein n=1 Tax=Burkholderia thailandensis TaxID=57975 RepID=A0AAW9D3E3_BURTH|nr:hypothetical protein [Burkholderia thailandensis]
MNNNRAILDFREYFRRSFLVAAETQAKYAPERTLRASAS